MLAPQFCLAHYCLDGGGFLSVERNECAHLAMHLLEMSFIFLRKISFT